MSKVHVITRAVQTTMGQIADSGAMPITKTPIKTTGTDARQWARDIVCSAFEADSAHQENGKARLLAIIRGTVDGRVAIVEEAKMQLDMLIAADDPRVASLRTTKSVLTVIARAFNVGATENGLLKECKGLSIDDMTQKHVIDYARKFLKSDAKGRGRPVRGVLARLDSMLKDCSDPQVFDKLSDDDKVILKRLEGFRAQFEA